MASVDARRAAVVRGRPFEPPARQPDNLAAYIFELASSNPNGSFVEVDRYGRQQARTYGGMLERALRLVPQVQGRSKAHSRTALFCFPSFLDFVAASWACLFCGVSWTPVPSTAIGGNSTGFNSRLGQLAGILRDSFIFTDSTLGGVIAERPQGMGHDDVLVIDAAESDESPGGQSGQAPGQARSDILIPTSGTTDKPKLAILGADSLMNRFFDGFELTHRVSLYTLAHHSVAGIRMLLPVGRKVIYLNPLRLAANPKEWFSVVDVHGVTDAGMGSFIASILTDRAERQDLGCSTAPLERLGFGAEIIVPELIERLLAALRRHGMGEVSLSFVYSMTETGPIFRSIVNDRAFTPELHKSGGMLAIREPVAGWSVRIVDEEGKVCRQGETGQIQVQSDSKLFAGYVNIPESEYLTEDGWFRTGDLGRLVENRLVPLGRESTVINVNARKLACEEIERALHGVAGVVEGCLVAAPCRSDASHTDELVIFFTPSQTGAEQLEAVRREIVSRVSSFFGLSVKHLVPVASHEIQRTDTMKVRRYRMVEKYRQGTWDSLPDRCTVVRGEPSPRLTLSIQLIWMEALELDEPPGPEESFFDLGGDSLGAAKLVFAFEEKFAIRLPLEQFFDCPTVARMVEVASQAQPGQPRRDGEASPEKGRERPSVFRYVATHSAAWPGKRKFSDSLVVGQNTEGDRLPLFWVFQASSEWHALGAALGCDYPVYGMRSCVGALPTASYSQSTVGSLVDRYLWELLGIAGDGHFYLGGNCQGGILALMMARRLMQADRWPQRLFLLEWSFDHGEYDGPVEIIYGGSSYTWREYVDDTDRAVMLSDMFSDHRLSKVPGAHGEYFQPDQVPFLAAVLRDSMSEGARTGL